MAGRNTIEGSPGPWPGSLLFWRHAASRKKTPLGESCQERYGEAKDRAYLLLLPSYDLASAKTEQLSVDQPHATRTDAKETGSADRPRGYIPAVALGGWRTTAELGECLDA